MIRPPLFKPWIRLCSTGIYDVAIIAHEISVYGSEPSAAIDIQIMSTSHQQPPLTNSTWPVPTLPLLQGLVVFLQPGYFGAFVRLTSSQRQHLTARVFLFV